MTLASALGTDLRAALGRGDLVTGAAVPEFRVGGTTPAWVARPADVDELQACLRAAAAADAAVVPCGLGARLNLGRRPERLDLVLSTAHMNRIVAHEAADMTLVVEAGATLAAIDAVLAEYGQRLPVDPPLPERTTVGGLIAADAFGPLRAAEGRVRDLLIGVRIVLADGTRAKGGGRVVKNVAGYDLMKLLCGSFGTLAVIVEAAFKLRPRPAHLRAGVLRCGDLAEATATAARLAALSFVPACARVLSGEVCRPLDGDGPLVVLGLEGSAAEVAATARDAAAALGREPRWHEGDDAHHVVAAARAAQVAGAGDLLVVRAGVRPAALPALVDAVATAAQTAGATLGVAADAAAGAVFLRIAGSPQAAKTVALAARQAAATLGGFAVFGDVDAALADDVDPWGEVGALELMRGIKKTLDPGRCLSPGRFVGGI